uniref:Uncharacterized protein n=1 Tax=Tanacetum cinerariifolium TaxID=118510 RepID=A0A6L2JU40_TANCI|nr:hypothetical protein [Tanacetum cinerariifolium]
MLSCSHYRNVSKQKARYPWMRSKLNFVKESVEILERDFKKLKQSWIPIVKRMKGVDVVNADVSQTRIQSTMNPSRVFGESVEESVTSDKSRGIGLLFTSTPFESYISTGSVTKPTGVTAFISSTTTAINSFTPFVSSPTSTHTNPTNVTGIRGFSTVQLDMSYASSSESPIIHSERVVNSDLHPTKGNGDACVFNIVPNMLNIVEIFGVPFNTFVDIKNLMDGIEMGKHENVCVASNVGNMAMDTSNDDTMHVDDPLIVQSVIIQDKPRSYVGVAGGSKMKPSKSKANFRSLSSKNLCEGANFSIPRKVVETISTRFANTLYGYFPGKLISFPVVEYYRVLLWVFLIDDLGFTIETVFIEYKWKLPRRDLYKIFGHVQDHCPKKASVPPTIVTSSVVTPIVITFTIVQTNDRFQTVGKKKKRGNTSKSSSMLNNQPPKVNVPSNKEGNINMSNSYAALDDESDEDVENMYDESANLFHHTETGESSSTFTIASG